MKIILLILISSFFSNAQTHLLLIGGGPRPIEAMQEFTKLAGNDNANILIIPWASETTEGAEIIKNELSNLSRANLQIVPHHLGPKAIKNLVLSLENSSGIFFTGGDQNTLMSFIRKYQLTEFLKKRFYEGMIFAGTSAGTAIMSNPMLTGEADLTVINSQAVELAEGLGLLPSGIIVDQHFIVRQRFNRLAGLIHEDKAKIGLGIDEGASVLISDSEARVLGPKQVMMLKKTRLDAIEVSIKNSRQLIELKI